MHGPTLRLEVFRLNTNLELNWHLQSTKFGRASFSSSHKLHKGRHDLRHLYWRRVSRDYCEHVDFEKSSPTNLYISDIRLVLWSPWSRMELTSPRGIIPKPSTIEFNYSITTHTSNHDSLLGEISMQWQVDFRKKGWTRIMACKQQREPASLWFVSVYCARHMFCNKYNLLQTRKKLMLTWVF